MSNNNNQLNIPQAREAMDKFKMQAASEVGVNLQNSTGNAEPVWDIRKPCNTLSPLQFSAATMQTQNNSREQES